MKHYIGASNPMREQFNPQASYVAEHFSWSFEGGVGTVMLNRPERKNPLLRRRQPSNDRVHRVLAPGFGKREAVFV